MFTTRITKKTSLKKFPVADLTNQEKQLKELKKDSVSPLIIDDKDNKLSCFQLARGDLHANALLFLNVLGSEGILRMEEKEYQKIFNIYHKEPDKLTEQDIEDYYDSIINKATINQFHAFGVIKLFGDMLADLGQNDLFILIILLKLKKENLPYEILLSDHDMAFLKVYETNARFDSLPELPYWSCNSMRNLQKIIDKGLVTRQYINELFACVHQSHLNLLSYTLNIEKDGIVIDSHAAVGQATILAVAKVLKVYSEEKEISTFIRMAKKIDEINNAFYQYVAQKKVHTLYKSDAEEWPLDKYAFESIIHATGRVNYLSRRGLSPKELEERDAELKFSYFPGQAVTFPGRRESETFQFRNGHTSIDGDNEFIRQTFLQKKFGDEWEKYENNLDIVVPYVFSLDDNNTLGKKLTDSHAYEGMLQLCYSYGTYAVQPRPQPIPELLLNKPESAIKKFPAFTEQPVSKPILELLDKTKVSKKSPALEIKDKSKEKNVQHSNKLSTSAYRQKKMRDSKKIARLPATGSRFTAEPITKGLFYQQGYELEAERLFSSTVASLPAIECDGQGKIIEIYRDTIKTAPAPQPPSTLGWLFDATIRTLARYLPSSSPSPAQDEYQPIPDLDLEKLPSLSSIGK